MERRMAERRDRDAAAVARMGAADNDEHVEVGGDESGKPVEGTRPRSRKLAGELSCSRRIKMARSIR